jgi:spermidine synthase
LELTQTRILSFVFWNHAVYLTVSIALLGFGISGTLVALLVSRRSFLSPGIMVVLWATLGASTFLAMGITAWLIPLLPGSRWVRLAVCYVIYIVPFIAAGGILSILFASGWQSFGLLYAVDLLSAGAACFLFFIVLPLVGAPALICLLSASAFLLAVLWNPRERSLERVVLMTAAASLVTLAGATEYWPSLIEFPTEPHKELAYMLKDSEEARIESTTWTPITRIDIIGNKSSNLLGYDLPKGSFKVVTQDATANTPLLSTEAIEHVTREAQKGQYYKRNMMYAILHQPDVAVIGVGGGIDVAYALGHGARSVFGVELNPATYRYLIQTYGAYTGNLAQDPRVTLVNGEGRNILRQTNKTFDGIQISGIDTFAALSSGAYVLSENYLYTVEALIDLFQKLKPGGIVSFSRWLFHPPRESLRLSAIACEAFKRLAEQTCDQRIMVIGAEGWATSLFKNEPFTAQEMRQLAQAAADSQQSVLYWPKVLSPEDQARLEQGYYAHQSEEVQGTARAWGGLIGAYAAGTPESFLASYRYNVAPTTDDSPFFFEYHFLNVFGLPHLWDLRGDDNAGRTLYLMLAQATVFSALAIFWPLYRFQRNGLQTPGVALYTWYFAALGFGFMVIEIALTQKVVLFLGSPLHALSVVLATLLVSAGVGSLWFGRLQWTLQKTARTVGVFFIIEMIIIILGLTSVLQFALHWSFPLRIAVAVAALAPLGLLMGFFFPAGIRAVGTGSRAFVPWAWGINGCMSVYGSVIAILIAMVFGFNIAIAIGTAIYASAFVLVQFMPSEALHRAFGSVSAGSERFVKDEN